MTLALLRSQSHDGQAQKLLPRTGLRVPPPDRLRRKRVEPSAESRHEAYLAVRRHLLPHRDLHPLDLERRVGSERKTRGGRHCGDYRTAADRTLIVRTLPR